MHSHVTLEIAAEDPDQPDVRALLTAAEAYSASLYPAESNHHLDLDGLRADNVRFFVARRAGMALGCVALVVEPDGAGEIKSLWVDPAARGLALGRRLLDAIERAAGDEAVTTLRLETGISQHQALGLYRSSGYREIGPFGSYNPDPLSIFMEKCLA